mgnify:CR=1 FL=1
MSKPVNPGDRAPCHPEAYSYLLSAQLSPTMPPFAVSYRQMLRLADTHGWSPLPSERSLRRRLAVDLSTVNSSRSSADRKRRKA